jgi:hypothetical protein
MNSTGNGGSSSNLVGEADLHDGVRKWIISKRRVRSRICPERSSMQIRYFHRFPYRSVCLFSIGYSVQLPPFRGRSSDVLPASPSAVALDVSFTEDFAPPGPNSVPSRGIPCKVFKLECPKWQIFGFPIRQLEPSREFAL